MKNVRFILTILLAVWSVVPHEALAQPEGPEYEYEYEQVPPGIEGRDVPGKGKHSGWLQGRHGGWDKEEMEELKEKDPQKFKGLIAKRQAEIQKMLERIKEEDPERYRKLMRQIRLRREKMLQYCKENDPEKFKELLKRKKEHLDKRLEEIKEENPEEYERIIKHREEIKEFQRLRKEEPEKAREYLQEHPYLRNRLKGFRDRFEGVQGGREGRYGGAATNGMDTGRGLRGPRGKGSHGRR